GFDATDRMPGSRTVVDECQEVFRCFTHFSLARWVGSGQKKTPGSVGCGGFWEEAPGDDLLSHRSGAALSSALCGFTSEFGMGSGGSRTLWSPGRPVGRAHS